MTKWGGPREGAGRKPKEPGQRRVSLSTRISGPNSEALRAYAGRTGKTLSQALDDFVAYAAGQPPFAALLNDLEAQHAPPNTIAKLMDAASAFDDMAKRVEHSEDVLADQQAFIRTLVGQLPGALIVLDEAGQVRLANDAAGRYLGQLPDTLVGRTLQSVLPGLGPEALQAMGEVMAAGGTWRQYGLPFPLSGSLPSAHWDVSLSPVTDARGARQGYLAYATEVTDRVDREQALSHQWRAIESQRQLLENIMKCAPAGMLFMDSDFVVRWINDAYLRLRHRSFADYLNRHYFDDVSPDMREAFEARAKRVLQTGETEQGNVASPSKPGVRWDFAILPVFDGGRRPIGLLLFVNELC